ncbi:uncharacterized protein LOC124359849 [Homalodisca vitripennis]|uniref:uncharacterized protein LOC124359849 n=1 Tax=Homalodisca vitripennis TaxID=197043 RepID=UPI001EE9D808|nr:uncharacterized protein LOC124359849 [Homalodisca vitripennis]
MRDLQVLFYWCVTVLILQWRHFLAIRNISCLEHIATSQQLSEFINVTTESNTCKILLGTEDFKTLRLFGDVFVDKSEMINEYLSRGGLILVITRPTKWGKTVNINMFKRFFEIEVDDKGVPVSKESAYNRLLFTGGCVDLREGKIRKLKPLKIAQFSSAMDHQAAVPAATSRAPCP